ncbi:uncharacterized protein A4U43_C07F250 [Asparagus officinalis]|uniref:Yippee domain-containing protein n=1 Tax=Asparagus officinalis TaxID=4686 RepID=A0A5P1EBD2_ASPOF|nr:uncharacterized protein A4U43_C07F250 [Asparagus officinalis]
MGLLFVIRLEGRIYSCKHCQTHLALSHDILSRTFHCRHGKMSPEPELGTSHKPLSSALPPELSFECVSVYFIGHGSNIDANGLNSNIHNITLALLAAEGNGDAMNAKRALPLNRFKVTGPDGSNYLLSHEVHVGGSDTDDV